MQFKGDKFLAATYSLTKSARLTKKLFPMILETIIEKLLVCSDGEKNEFETNNTILNAIIDFCSTSKTIDTLFLQ